MGKTGYIVWANQYRTKEQQAQMAYAGLGGQEVNITLDQLGKAVAEAKTTQELKDKIGQAQAENFERANVQSMVGDYIPNEAYLNLDPKYQKIYISEGFKKMQEAITNDTADFEKTHVKLGDGNYITNEDYQALDPKYQAIATTKGLEEMNRAIEVDKVDQDNAYIILQSYKGDKSELSMADLARLYKDNPNSESIMKDAGFKQESIDNVKDYSEAEDKLKPYLETVVLKQNVIDQWVDRRTG